MDVQKYKKFMPSAKFLKVMAVCIGGVLLILILTSLKGSKGTFDAKGLFSDGATVSDLVTQDSNKNGIADWEESLWGFDPNGNGEENRKAIEARKVQARIAAGETETMAPATATDTLSRSLVSTILALQQSGTLTTEALTNLAASLGDSVDAVHADVPTYTQADMVIVADDMKAKQAYANAMLGLAQDYDELGFGSELGIIGLSFDTENEALLAKLDPIADGYISFGKKVLALPTPRSAAAYGLGLANASVRMGAYLKQVEKLPDDVLAGMVGLNDYIEASKLSDQAAESLKAYFGV